MRQCTLPIRIALGGRFNGIFCVFLTKKWPTAIVSLKAAPWQYFPKKTKAVYTSAYLADCRQKLNTRPRKCLGFASPASRFFFGLNKLHFKVESAIIYNSKWLLTSIFYNLPQNIRSINEAKLSFL